MKTVVNVKTPKEWDNVTKKLGYVWHISEWEDNREKSCICLHENAQASIDFFKTDKNEDWKIIPYDEFMGNKNKEYKLIITPTNSTIIIDKETGKKGMARLHPDDKYDFLEGVKVAMDKLNEEFVKWEKLKSLPKLYDSFGEELNDGDRFILIDLKDNKNCTDNTSYVKSDGEELFSNGIRIFHNSKRNEGKPTNGWQVIKIK